MPATELLDQLPASVLEAIRGSDDSGEQEFTEKQLDTVATLLVGTRKKYRDFRAQSGMEDIMLRCEEHYIGMDDGNRHEFKGQRFQVPPVPDAPLVLESGQQKKDEQPRCTLYVRLTARYVDAGAAKVQEIVIAPDEKSFSYDPTPIPSLMEKMESNKPVLLPDGSPAERDARPDELAGQPQPLPQPPTDPNAPEAPLPPGVPIVERDLAAEQFEQVRKSVKKAEKRVEDWHVEAQMPAKMRRVIADSARLGVGVLKGPFPCLRKAVKVIKDPESGEVSITFDEQIKPDYKAVSPWNLFPSPACGENVRNGEGLFERDYLSQKQVEDLALIPGYIKKYIHQVIREGPGKRLTDNADPSYDPNAERYEVWYWYGSLDRDDWDAIQRAGYEKAEERTTLKEDQTSVPAIVTMINDCVVYASTNPLQSGTIPFYTFPWQVRPGSWIGVGVAEQVDAPQRALVAAFRNLLDNAGLSAGAQIVIDRDAVRPADGSSIITKLKLWEKGAECDDVRKAFTIFQIPNVTVQMLEVINLNYRIAEESCNIPLISQGQSGDTTPDTYGATKLQDNNANQLLRGIAAGLDDSVTEPRARADYEWLLLDPNVPADEKLELQINAHGSSALVERAIQDQVAVQQLELVMKGGEILGADPKKVYRQYLKANRLNPADYMYTKEELEQKAKQPPPKDPRLQVAEVKAQVDLKKAAMDTDRDRVYVEAETEQNKNEHEERMIELSLKRELELLKYANEQKITLMEVKAQLASDAMKLRTQKELSAVSAGMELHKHSTPEATSPPTEPAGKAPVGESFQA